MLDYVEIGQNIVTLRKVKGLTQEELALESDMSVSFLREIEHGRANASLTSLRKLADTLGVDAWVLFLYGMDDESILSILHKVRQTAAQEARR